MNGFSAADMTDARAKGYQDRVEHENEVAAQEAVAYWRVTFRMYRDDPELCVLFVGGQEQPTLDSLGVTPRPLELVCAEPRFVKQHRWDQYGERCLDCGDKDWMNDPVCRQRLADPSIEATPSIAVNPSTEVTAKLYTAPVAAAPVDLHAAGLLHVLGATDFADASRIVGDMLAQASTPAAPGIDLELLIEIRNRLHAMSCRVGDGWEAETAELQGDVQKIIDSLAAASAEVSK